LIKYDIHNKEDVEPMEERINRMMPILNEKQKRLFLASEARSLGRGGIARVCRTSGCSKNTVRAGIAELNANNEPNDRIRKRGAGPTCKEEYFPYIKEKIHLIVEERVPMAIRKMFFCGQRKVSVKYLIYCIANTISMGSR
jgi:hypothetical protein